MAVRTQILLLIAACLAAFFSVFSANICSIDDADLFLSLKNLSASNPFVFFTQKAEKGLYYRPIQGITFWFDKNLFQLSPFWMHLENVLIHLTNILLVFFICRSLFNNEKSYMPLLAALLWGLHPLTTESVNWISGRTDLIAGMFIFAATLCIIRYKYFPGIMSLFLAMLFTLTAILSKEVAIAFIPGALLILNSSLSNDASVSRSSCKSWLLPLVFIMSACVILGIFFWLRSNAFDSNSSRIGITLQYIQINPVHSFMLILRAFGFYMKKMLIPWPLSFAITDVDPLYELAAIPIALLCLFLLFNKSIFAALFMTGIFLITPSFLISLGQIAWTPYAERYLYISLAFVIVSIMGYLSKHQAFMKNPIYMRRLLIILISVLGVATFHRSTIWQNNLKILADTAKKSPAHKRTQWVYGSALANVGEYEKALKITQKAIRLRGSPLEYDQHPEISLGYIQLNLGNIEDGIHILEEVEQKSKNPSYPALKGILDAYTYLARASEEFNKKMTYYEKAISYSQRVFKINNDPLVWYNLGKLSLDLKLKQDAAQYFFKAYKEFPSDNVYRDFSYKLYSQINIRPQRGRY